MKMLLIIEPTQVDEVIMFVEDDFDRENVIEIARDYTDGNPEIRLELSVDGWAGDLWRPFVG